jgi:hypothetical protein
LSVAFGSSAPSWEKISSTTPCPQSCQSAKEVIP